MYVIGASYRRLPGVASGPVCRFPFDAFSLPHKFEWTVNESETNFELYINSAASPAGARRNPGAVRLLLQVGQAVGALVHGRVGLMGADADLVQGAEVLGPAVVGAVAHAALDTFVGMTIHCSFLLWFGTALVCPPPRGLCRRLSAEKPDFCIFSPDARHTSFSLRTALSVLYWTYGGLCCPLGCWRSCLQRRAGGTPAGPQEIPGDIRQVPNGGTAAAAGGVRRPL